MTDGICSYVSYFLECSLMTQGLFLLAFVRALSLILSDVFFESGLDFSPLSIWYFISSKQNDLSLRQCLWGSVGVFLSYRHLYLYSVLLLSVIHSILPVFIICRDILIDTSGNRNLEKFLKMFLEYMMFFFFFFFVCFNNPMTELQQCIHWTAVIHSFLSQEILLM